MVCLFAACGVRRDGQEPSLEGDREISTVSQEESGEDVDSVPKQSDRAENDTGVHPYDSVFPQHEPYGKGTGAMPGRVVWDYDTASVLWDGEGFWWRPQNFDESVIQRMVNDSIASLGGRRRRRRDGGHCSRRIMRRGGREAYLTRLGKRLRSRRISTVPVSLMMILPAGQRWAIPILSC